MLDKIKRLKKSPKEGKKSNDERLMVGLDIGTEFIKALVCR